MPLCGSANGCGCAITSIPADSGEINGFLPTINVDGSGTPDSPWNLTLNDEWTSAIVDALTFVPANTAPTPAAGWSIGTFIAYASSKFLSFYLEATRTSLGPTPNTSTGDMANTVVATMPPELTGSIVSAVGLTPGTVGRGVFYSFNTNTGVISATSALGSNQFGATETVSMASGLILINP